ncbi:MAG: hypothetical protein BAA01_03605 [Bacillus thermozeamaize]|jgi:hypothetical protein|uniref:Uncharacterized protein n=1 Tax=Bacillus thermozeamaize TaxID=230954 RepID=A0A1Y3PT39_9BACI|nr:MAG: hypothetical protein BAA01_03605 [Bacillus thermozeamaize]
MLPPMVPYLMQTGHLTYQDVQLYWREANKAVERVEMVPSGKGISSWLTQLYLLRRDTAGYEKGTAHARHPDDLFRRTVERQLYPHLGQHVDGYI